MGRGIIKQKNNLKKQYLAPLKAYAEQLEKENHALKNDPNTVIGQFIGQFKEIYAQNSRLSVLCACLIAKLGDNVTLTKEQMESFQQKRINIKWEIPDGVEPGSETEYVFTYELQDAPPEGQPVQQTQQPGEIPECTDPGCTLPKDLKHTHDAVTVSTGEEIPTLLSEIESGDTLIVDGEERLVTSVSHEGNPA